MSNLQQALEFVQVADYASGFSTVGVVYDYFLTFSREVEYIWLKPWTWVSTLFVMVRYLGILQALLIGIINSTSFPITATMYDLKFSPQTKLLTITQRPRINASYSTLGTVFFLVDQWLFILFFVAVDLIMILRIYAMWGRSKIILGFCLFVYVSHMIITFVFAAIYDNPNTYMSGAAVKYLDVSVCYITLNYPSAPWLYMIPGYIVSAILLILPLLQICKESFYMYRATKKWEPNQYMSLLVKHGVVYFVIRLSFAVGAVFNFAELIVGNLSTMLLFSILPRFIISIRELYDHDSRHQSIDTGFGILSRFVAANNVMSSGIVFADDGANGEIGDADMTPLPVITSRV